MHFILINNLMASITSTNIIFSLSLFFPPRPKLYSVATLTSPCPSPALQLQTKRRRASLQASSSAVNSPPRGNGAYKVADFMTSKEHLHVVKPTTPVDQALETLVEKRVAGFPVIDDDWKLVGVVSDYDLLALDSISGVTNPDTNVFPDVDSSWKAFNRIQKLLSKTHGKVVGDLMSPNPLVVRETTNLGDAARLLLQTKYHRLPVVDSSGRLVGLITRGDIVRAALMIKRAS